MALCLLSMNMVAGVVGLVAAYVLIQRSSEELELLAETLCQPKLKSSHLSAMNQFPVTVEEEVISKMLPSLVNATTLEYKPVMGDIHDAV